MKGEWSSLQNPRVRKTDEQRGDVAPFMTIESLSHHLRARKIPIHWRFAEPLQPNSHRMLWNMVLLCSLQGWGRTLYGGAAPKFYLSHRGVREANLSCGTYKT